MSANATPAAAELRRLAEAEEACEADIHNVGGKFVTVLCQCHGTGRVPLFRDAEGKALFRKQCEGAGGIACPVSGAPLGNPMPNIYGEPKRCVCRGLGWLRLDIDEVHLETIEAAADSAGFDMQILYPGPAMVVIDRRTRHALDEKARFARSGANRVEAALLALDAALAARA